jgi:hypothetical protein
MQIGQLFFPFPDGFCFDVLPGRRDIGGYA